MKTKVFITGISSEIMLRFASLIDFTKYEVVGLTRNPEFLHIDHVVLVKGDICNPRQFVHHVESSTIIIHAAAVTHSFGNDAYYHVNLDATKKLVDIAKKDKAKKIIFISSNTAGYQSGTYGLTKLMSEEYIQQNLNHWTILRLAEIYGGGKKEGIEKLIENVLTKSFVLCPVGVPTKFFPIHIDDVVRLIHTYSLNQDTSNKISIVNGPKGFSCLEIITLVKAISGRNVHVIFIRRKWIFFIKRIASLLPFHLGIIPDQIDRLYSEKRIEKQDQDMMPLASYIKKRVLPS